MSPVETGTSGGALRSISVILRNAGASEVARTNYFNCFPKKYEHFRGFVQDIQATERSIVQCGFREAG